jgi:hypothetical protein
VPEQDADVLEVLIGQMGERRDFNPVFSKTPCILGHAEFFEPIGNLLHWRPPRILRYPFWSGTPETLPHSTKFLQRSEQKGPHVRLGSILLKKSEYQLDPNF